MKGNVSRVVSDESTIFHCFYLSSTEAKNLYIYNILKSCARKRGSR